MNLLISLLGDTYSQVQEVADIEDLKQLIEIILEVENLYFWNKSNRGKQYIQICDSFRIPPTDNSVLKKIKKVKTLNLNILKVSNGLLTPDQNKTSLQTLSKSLFAEIEKSKIELSNKISDLNIKINELSLSKLAIESETEKAYVPVCLKGHNLLVEERSFAFCDLCKQFVGTSSLCCSSCNFDMCEACVNWNSTTKVYKDSACFRDHELRDSQIDQLKPPEVEILTYICRCCNNEVNDEVISYCRYCCYGVCIRCKDVISKSKDIIHKTKCEKKHELKWTVANLYSGLSNVVYCSECKKKFLGAGMFSCEICKYHMCTPCFTNKYI